MYYAGAHKTAILNRFKLYFISVPVNTAVGMYQNTPNVAHIIETSIFNNVLVPGEPGRLESHIPSYHGNLAARVGKAQSFT